jgi:acyl carrier protein
MNDTNKTMTATRCQPGANAVPAYLKGLWEEILRVPRVNPDDGFFSLGGDSVLVVEMLITIQAHFDQEFDFIKFFPEPNIRTLGVLIIEQLKLHHDQPCG